MDPITQQVVLATAGAAGAGEATYVDDVFSTFLYEGTAATHQIVNGIDLSGEGGLVWIKRRDGLHGHRLTDTERGATKALESSSEDYERTHSTGLTAFNSDGFSLGSNAKYNGSGYEMCSWTFRKAPGFFDVVTYTGNGVSGRAISHNLGSAPGMILVKRTDASGSWLVYHRSQGISKYAWLNLTNTFASGNDNHWGSSSSEPTSTSFQVGNGSHVNASGGTYVAYLFAHDDQSFGTDSDEAIIKCGSYTGNGGTQEINLGFEPQFLLIKGSSVTTDWHAFDNMRGITGANDPLLRPNDDAAELTSYDYFDGLTPTGFKLTSLLNTSSNTYVYMAIRRPHKPPTAGTDVFKAVQTTSQPFSVGFPTDLNINAPTTNSGSKYWVPRLTNGYMSSTAVSNESAGSTYFKFDLQNSFSTGTFWGTYETINWQFRRAPGFFDVVTYTGDGSNLQTESHNLGAVPELMIVKARDYSGGRDWAVYSSVTGNSKFIYLHRNDAPLSTSIWASTTPTSTQFTVGPNATVNHSGTNYIAYFFATLDGISKIGSYTGTGSNVNVDCGFTAGARFVLIRRTDSSGDWYVWDTTRGIVSGNDPYLLLNSTAAQVTNTDYIDPLNAGFTVTSSAPAALNTSGGTYLFLAIA